LAASTIAVAKAAKTDELSRKDAFSITAAKSVRSPSTVSAMVIGSVMLLLKDATVLGMSLIIKGSVMESPHLTIPLSTKGPELIGCLPNIA
jgi:hypothetical protein